MPLVFYPPQPVADPYTHELRPDLFGAEVTVTDPATGQPLTGLVEANSGAPMSNPVKVGPTGYTPSMAKEDGPPLVNIVSGDFVTPIWSPSGAAQYMGNAQAAITAARAAVEASAQAARDAAAGANAPVDDATAALVDAPNSQTRARLVSLIEAVAPDAGGGVSSWQEVASLEDTPTALKQSFGSLIQGDGIEFDVAGNTATVRVSGRAPARVVAPGVGGAAGDGIANDTAAIQAAIDAAATADSAARTVILARGIYRVTGIQLAAGVTLRGEGATLVRAPSSTTTPVVTIPATATGARLVGVEIDGNAAGQTGNVIGVVVQAERAQVTDCYVHDVKWDGISASSPARWVVIAGNHVLTTGRYGITITVSDVTPEHIIVHGNTVEGSNDGALGIVGRAEHVVFSSNTTRNSGGDGIAAYAPTNRNIVCVGNAINTPGGHGIHLGGQGLVIDANAIQGVSGAGHGLFLWNSDDSHFIDATVSNNTVRGVATGCGARLVEGESVAVTGNVIDAVNADGIYAEDVFDVTVQGNVIRNTTVGRGVYLVRGQRVAITGNTLRNIGSFGIYGRDYNNLVDGPCQHVTITGNTIHTTTGRGIQSVENSDRWLVDANTIVGWTTAAVTLTGVNNVLGTNLTA